jgi:hypothetical protein
VPELVSFDALVNRVISELDEKLSFELLGLSISFSFCLSFSFYSEDFSFSVFEDPIGCDSSLPPRPDPSPILLAGAHAGAHDRDLVYQNLTRTRLMEHALQLRNHHHFTVDLHRSLSAMLKGRHFDLRSWVSPHL